MQDALPATTLPISPCFEPGTQAAAIYAQHEWPGYCHKLVLLLSLLVIVIVTNWVILTYCYCYCHEWLILNVNHNCSVAGALEL